jgi:hypothetical protein
MIPLIANRAFHSYTLSMYFRKRNIQGFSHYIIKEESQYKMAYT